MSPYSVDMVSRLRFFLNYFSFIMSVPKIGSRATVELSFPMSPPAVRFPAFSFTARPGWTRKREALKQEMKCSLSEAHLSRVKCAHVSPDGCCIRAYSQNFCSQLTMACLGFCYAKVFLLLEKKKSLLIFE